VSEDLQEIIDNNPEWYLDLQYKDVKVFIQNNINSTCRSFVAIGFYLKYIRDKKMYANDGYESVWELAQAEFGIGKSQASKFMSINDKFSKDGNSPILMEKYKDFSSSKLSEMLYLTDEQLEQVTLTTTVAEIREIKNPEKAVSTSKQDCFIKNQINDTGEDGLKCSGTGWDECKGCDKSEQKPSGNCIHRPEYPCTLPEASKIAKGNGENCSAKCCWNCEKREGCGYQCNSSALRPKEVKQGLQYFDMLAAYWCKREMTVELYELAKSDKDEDIDVFNRYFKEKYTLGECYAPAYNSPGYEISFRTDKSGIHFDDKEKTGYSWQLLIDLVCQEAENDTPASKPTNLHENPDGLRRLREIKKEVRTGNRVNNNLKPDGILETVNAEPEIVDNEPEIVNDVDENVIEIADSVIETAETVIEHPQSHCNDCKYYRDGAGDKRCKHCFADELKCEPIEPDPVETVEADIIQTVPDELPKPIFSAEYHLREAIKREEEQLKQLGETWLMKQPDTYLKHQTILIALKCHLTDMEYPVPEPVKPVQPELPILKNNDQRKEFIDSYESWPIWIDQKETGELYYRYDLSDNVAIVIKVSLSHIHQNYKETKDVGYGTEQYYLLGIKSEWRQTGVVFTEDKSRTFIECSSNKSALVDYLRYFQKK
jgi:hypothetical protein